MKFPGNRRIRVAVGIAGFAAAMFCGSAFAQDSTGPVNPNPPPPVNPSGDAQTIIINPTAGECAKGWNPTLKWPKEKFDDFCTKLNASK
jgi:hypothetical protein